MVTSPRPRYWGEATIHRSHAIYAVDDATFQGATAILSALAKQLTSQEASGARRLLDLRELLRRSAQVDLPEGGEVDYLHAIADNCERMFPIDELLGKRRDRKS